jgi:hypothetical protein
MPRHLPSNSFERIPFAVFGIEVITSVRPNLDEEKVQLAVREALSLWASVTPLSFEPPRVGEEPLLRIQFESDGQPNEELGHADGSISSTPTGPIGAAGIHIDADNLLFVDRFLESFSILVHGGPFDLIAVIAHEIGHGLGLDHPPKDPATGQDTEFCMMSPEKGTAVVRQLFPFDIREVQKRHGAIELAGTVSSDLPTTGRLIDVSSPDIKLQRAGSALVVSGPMESSTLLDVLVPAKNFWINALHLKFTTITKNVFVNRVRVFDGFLPLQRFAVSARNSGDEGLTGKSWDLRLGFLARPRLTSDMIVRLELFFTQKDGDAQEFGVLQLTEVSVETLPPAINPTPVMSN